LAKNIFLSAVESVKPDRLIFNSVHLSDSLLTIEDLVFDLNSIQNIYIVGVGKASALMGQAIEKILLNKITGGHILTKYGHGCALQKISLSEAGHPIPDDNGIRGTKKIVDIVNKAREQDLVICLISGGGSALLADCPAGSVLTDLTDLSSHLLNCGADIKEINTIRKHLSEVKGGNLARAAYPATLVSLILSDVIGDPVDVIASGPTTYDLSTFQNAYDSLKKYNLIDKISPTLLKRLQEGLEGKIAENPKPGDPILSKTYNKIIGNNMIALKAAEKTALSNGYTTEIISDKMQGMTHEIIKTIIDISLEEQRKTNHPCCLLFGGEPTVKVNANGLGGRNQHIALEASLLLKGKKDLVFLSAGTDGSDGPTDAAGAVVDDHTYLYAENSGMPVEETLQNFDSYNFFKNTVGHIITGPTMTNVMDIMIVLIN